MRRLYQRYRSDCFPTCIAMVADLSHAHALKLVHPIRFKGRSYTTQDIRAIQVLRELGYKVRKRYLKDFTKLKQPAILALHVNEEYGHVVIWDPSTRTVFNPTRGYDKQPPSYYKKRLQYVYLIT